MLAAAWFTFAASWLLPNHYMPWVNFHSEAMAAAALVLLLLHAGTSTHRLFIPRKALGIALVAVIPWVQWATGLTYYFGDALMASAYIALAVLAYVVGYLGSQPSSKDGTMVGLAATTFGAGALSTMVGMLQWLGSVDVIDFLAVESLGGDRALGNLGQPNQLGTLLLMSLASIGYLYERKMLRGVVLVLGVLVLTCGLILTQSRTAMLSGLAATVFLTWKQRALPLRIRPSMLFLWLITFFAGVYCVPYLADVLLLPNGRSVALSDSSGRWLIWGQMVVALKAAPWFGYGWDYTAAAQAVGAPAFPAATFLSNAHNVMLDLLLWNGIPLGVFLIVAGTYWVFTRFTGAKGIDATFACTLLLPCLLHSMLEFPFAYAYFLVAMGLAAGVVDARGLDQSSIAISRYALLGTTAAAAGLLGFLTREYFLIEEDFRVARFENLRVGTRPTEHNEPAVLLLTQLSARSAALRQPISANMSADELEQLRRVSLRYPDRRIKTSYAVALVLTGDLASATRQFEVLRATFGEPSYAWVRADVTQRYAHHLALRNYELP